MNKNIDSHEWILIKESNRLKNYLNFVFHFPESNKIDACIFQINKLFRVTPTKSYHSVLVIDSTKNRYWFEFNDTGKDYGDYNLKQRNSLVLTISNKYLDCDSLKRNLSLDLIKEKILNKLNNQSFKINYPERELKKINYFGTREVSKLVIVLDTDFDKNKTNNSIRWDLYFKTLQHIRTIYYELWNKLSIKTWNIPFDKLTFDKKIAVIENYNLNIELNLIKREFKINEKK